MKQRDRHRTRRSRVGSRGRCGRGSCLRHRLALLTRPDLSGAAVDGHEHLGLARRAHRLEVLLLAHRRREAGGPVTRDTRQRPI